MTAEATIRTRTYAYAKPTQKTPDLLGRTGLELLRAMIAGEISRPSMAATLETRIVEAEEGRVVFEGEPGEYSLNPMGVVHGGYAATLLDSAMGCAVQSVLPAGVSYTTVELKVNMVRSMPANVGKVRAEGRVVHAGNTILTAEGRIVRLSDGKLVAHGTTTCMVLRDA